MRQVPNPAAPAAATDARIETAAPSSRSAPKTARQPARRARTPTPCLAASRCTEMSSPVTWRSTHGRTAPAIVRPPPASRSVRRIRASYRPVGMPAKAAGGHRRLVNLVNEMLAARIDTTVLANRLRPVLLKLNRELRREIHSLGVTGGQVALLVQIKTHPGIGMRELASLERISVPGMSKFVARLEEADLVKREPVGGDRRRVGLTLTADGHRVLRSVRSKRTAWLAPRLPFLRA